MDPTFNLADLFELVAGAISEREALTCGDVRLTYRELDERATRLADAFATELGVRPGDHVGLDLYNCCEYVEATFACFKLRAVPINVNYRYVAAELASLFDNADLVGIVCDARTVDEVRAAAADRWVVQTGERYEALVAAGSPSATFPARSGDDHYVLYTGGTTGMPRGVVWRHEDIFFTALGSGNPGGPPITRPGEIAGHARTNRVQRLAPYLQDGDRGCEEFVAMSVGPLMHASGQWMAFGTLLGGGRAVLYDEPHLDLAKVLDLVERERIVMLSLIGDTAARPLVQALEADPGRWDTTSLRLLGSGGSILTAEMRERLLAALPTVLVINEAVGSSEAPVQALATAMRGAPTVQSLAFTAREGVTIVLDDELRPVEPGSGTEGWLAAGGRVPLGYYNDPEKTARTFVTVDGTRYSIPGDRAVVEADGTIRLLGRGALCINTGGEKVYPEEVEAVLQAHPAIEDAVVVGLPDEQWGQRVAAVVASPDGITSAEVEAHCRASLAGYKVPRTVAVVDHVERNPAGKADYRWAVEVAGLRA
ncbi:MAG: AMP-binding protein [Acidimicrobiia bacterium]|nr:AMP-binding protein [Acidimicrobiia bacterium]